MSNSNYGRVLCCFLRYIATSESHDEKDVMVNEQSEKEAEENNDTIESPEYWHNVI